MAFGPAFHWLPFHVKSGPIFADQEVHLRWSVSKVEWNAKLEGWLAHLDGTASVAFHEPAVVARGTIVVTEAHA